MATDEDGVREHEAAPLDVVEIQRMRAMAQELTRTDPGLRAGPNIAPPEPANAARVVVAAYAAGSCVAIGALAGALGP